MTVVDWITAIVAVLALLLSLYNTYVQFRDRTPRVKMVTSWNLPRDSPMAFRGSALPGQAFYRCEITNVGTAGVKINEVRIFHLRSAGKPIPLHLAPEEKPKKLDNGDSQTCMYDFGKTKLDPARLTSVDSPVKVIAWDTAGNTYQAKDPTPLP